MLFLQENVFELADFCSTLMPSRQSAVTFENLQHRTAKIPEPFNDTYLLNK